MTGSGAILPAADHCRRMFVSHANPARYDAHVPIGEVLSRDGRLTFEGQPLQDEAAAELTRRCQEIVYGKPE